LVAAVIRHARGPRGWQCRDRGGRQPPRQNRIGAWTGGIRIRKYSWPSPPSLRPITTGF